MANPKISIICPVYKAEKYLHRCVDSIIAQTFTGWELILVDDGSPDNSGKICDEYSAKDSRIRVFHKENGGVSSARNYGIKQAKYEWIVFVDSDDWVLPIYLESLMKLSLKRNTFVIVNYDENKKIGSHVYSGRGMLDGYLSTNIQQLTAPYCKLFNREVLDRNKLQFSENVYMGEDALFSLQYLNYVEEVVTKDIIGIYNYDKSTGGLHTRYYSFESEYECFCKWKKYLGDFINKNGIEKEERNRLLWNSRLNGTFYRTILSLSRQPKKISYSKFIKALDSIPRSDMENFCKYSQDNTIKSRLIKFVLSRRFFSIYYLLMLFDTYK